jgi:hypothetical protein
LKDGQYRLKVAKGVLGEVEDTELWKLGEGRWKRMKSIATEVKFAGGRWSRLKEVCCAWRSEGVKEQQKGK